MYIYIYIYKEKQEVDLCVAFIFVCILSFTEEKFKLNLGNYFCLFLNYFFKFCYI